MGDHLAWFGLLADVGSSLASFVGVFIFVYILLLFAYILTSWIRLPYNPWLNRVQRFLYDVCDPYLRIFRRFLPPLGPLDLSPMVAVITLLIVSRASLDLPDRAASRKEEPMALTPVEIRHLKPARGFLGYKRAVVDRLLAEIAESYEDVWRERADLADKVEQLELDLVRHKELEGLLRTTLVSAESAVAASCGSRRAARPRRRRRGARRGARDHPPRPRREGAPRDRAAPDQVAAALRAREPRRGGRRRARARRRVHRRDPPPIEAPARLLGPLSSGWRPRHPTAAACLPRRGPAPGVVGRHGDAWKVRVAARARAREGQRGRARAARRDARRSALERRRSFRAAARETRSSSWPASSRTRSSDGSPPRADRRPDDHRHRPLPGGAARSAASGCRRTIEHHDIGDSSLTEETGELMSSSSDNHLADTASETYERELDEGLEEDAREQLRAGRRGARADRRRHVRHLLGLRQEDPASSGSRRFPGRRSASTTRGSWQR